MVTTTEGLSRWPRTVANTRLSTVWVVACITVPTALAIATPLAAIDLAYHLRAGNLMLEASRILRTDQFAVPAFGSPWLDQQWGAQVALAAFFRAGGWLALALLRGAAAALVTSMVYAACRNSGATRRWAAGLSLATGVLGSGAFVVRPQLFGIVCFAATQWLLSRREKHPKSSLWVLPILLVWANTHGSFFLAIPLIAIAWAQDIRRGTPIGWPLVTAGLGAIPLTLINPFGIRIWGYAMSIATDPRIRNGVVEWQAPTVATVAGALFLVSVVATATFVGWRWRDATWPTLAGLGFFLALGFTSIRASLWWLLAAPVLIAPLTPRGTHERADPHTPLNAVLAIILCVIAIGPVVRWLPYTRQDPPGPLLGSAPIGITRALDRTLRPGQPFFNAQGWGSWFEFALPSNPVFVDSRWEVIPGSAWDAYAAISAGRSDWPGLLDAYGLRVVALSHEFQGPLRPLIEHDPAWRLVYEDDEGAVFVRSNADRLQANVSFDTRPAAVAVRIAAMRVRTPSLL